MILENGLQVWQALKSSGVQETRKHRMELVPGYDADLVSALKKGLYPRAAHSLERELRLAPPSVEVFLEVFFAALEPFSRMLRDVLGMFEDAGAKRSDENMRISFDFDEASTALTLTLAQFREVVAFVSRVSRPVTVRQWTTNTLFSLSHDIEDALQPLGAPTQVSDALIRDWSRRNGRPDWLPFPGIPRVGNTELDDALGMTEALVHYMIAEVRKVGTTYQVFTQRLHDPIWVRIEEQEAERVTDPTVDERPRLSFVHAAHDFWPNSFVERLSRAVEAVEGHYGPAKAAAATRLATAIQTGFARPPRHTEAQVSREQNFNDFVNLPIWKKRHELYAVWVASRIAEALRELTWEWHPDGDTLRFSFAGVELASLRSSDGNTHAFWTEKRTALRGGGVLGRKSIQPDYRIVTAPTQREDATSLVVECKQYRKLSRKNFGAALDDYAKGCPNAPVVLVNYGPTDPSVLDLVDASRRDRTYLVGNFKPGGEAALDAFRALLQTTYKIQVTPPIAAELEVELKWDSVYRDLDLHLFIRPIVGDPIQHVGFGSTSGSLTEGPWAEWPKDVRSSPPGVEHITIARLLDADYDLLVHDFSGGPAFSSGHVSVRVTEAPSFKEHVLTPQAGTGRWWHVCRFNGATGRFEEVNSIHLECPYLAHRKPQ